MIGILVYFIHAVHTVQCNTFKNSKKKTGCNTSNNSVHSGHVTPGAIVSVINPVYFWQFLAVQSNKSRNFSELHHATVQKLGVGRCTELPIYFNDPIKLYLYNLISLLNG